MKAEEVKKILEENIKKVKQMSVEEYTLYRKWLEINETKWSQKELARIWEIKNTIWVPDDPMDYLKLEPIVIHDLEHLESVHVYITMVAEFG